MSTETENDSVKKKRGGGKAGHRDWGWIRKRSSGRFQASYIGPDNQRHFAPTTFARKMDAEEWLANERRDIERAKAGLRNNSSAVFEWVNPKQRVLSAETVLVSEPNVKDYARRWIDQRDLRPRTQIQYLTLLDKHIAPKLGKMLVRQLNPATVRNWYATTLVDKPTYRAHAYQLLHAICKTAVADELLDRNPCMIEGATSVKTKTKAVVPTIEQMLAIENNILPKFKAYVLLGAWCGLRFSEAIELRRSDISDGCEIINVTRQAPHRAAPGTDIARCNVGPTKSGETRKIVVPQSIRADIQFHLDTYTEPGADGRLFVPARGGCHLADRVVRPAFRNACNAAGVIGMRLHDLRHFHGHQTARVGNLAETMARQGHSTQSAALRYIGEVSGRAVEVATDLDALRTTPDLAADLKEPQSLKAV